ncbi:carbohydrate kinase [Nocardioides sp. MAH-18]|uniref:Carbohydrate kinase n=1 Tax=Nocardioides agri TaxID=2682843 RepID=A0A6L6XTF2_9ACTN|nr:MULTISPECIES: carbohydrate kinase [unclassified Nocardioides]MBA2955211.1 carbohydrate kinase [Nocardioides sp. CGMCC 1.13656]MVQ50062.1 carbohydrate kinase [Nocardioides sp. MAH-18]
MSVLVIGEALVDVVHRTDGSVAEHPGGSPANVALGLGRLGRRVDLLTDLGDDARGTVVRSWLAASGARLLPTAGGRRTSTATARLREDGSAAYDFDLAWAPRGDVDPTTYDVVHTGSIAAVLEPGAGTVRDLLERAGETATITYDPNARPAIMGDRAESARRIEALVALSDVVKVSDEDLDWLYPGADPVTVIEEWRQRGPAVVAVTLGADGVVAAGTAGLVEVAGVPTAVVDTVGAGDTFMAALVDGLLELGLEAVASDRLEQVLARAARAAALNVARPGASPPTATELGPISR